MYEAELLCILTVTVTIWATASTGKTGDNGGVSSVYYKNEIAKGSDYTLTQADLDMLSLKDTAKYLYLDQIYMTSNPGNGIIYATDVDRDPPNETGIILPSALTPAGETYTVTFKDWDGTELKTETVEEGKAATAPSTNVYTPEVSGDVYTVTTNYDTVFDSTAFSIL